MTSGSWESKCSGSRLMLRSNCLDVFDPRLQQTLLLLVNHLRAHKFFITTCEILSDAFDAWFERKPIQRFANRAVVQITGNFVFEVAHQIMFVALLVSRRLVKQNAPIVCPGNS